LAERYDRDLVDIFAVQEEITRTIVTQIGPTIAASAYSRTRRAHPESLTAHELALRAWFESDVAYAGADATLREGTIALAEQALRLDPDCVLAWVTLGWLRWQAVFYSNRENSEEMCRAGFYAVRRAIELDPFEHRAYVIRGMLHVELHRHDDALADLRYACELNPNDARALQGLAFVELMSGEANAAKAHGLESLRLNPRDPTRYNTTSFLANACFFAGEYEEGLKWIEESKRERPGFRPTMMTAIKLYVGLGQLDRAKAEAALVKSPEIEARVRKGASVVRRPEDRERDLRFLRIGFGLEDPTSPAAPSPPALALPDKPSIAVLPFQNMSGDPEQEYFADGLVEDIITGLSCIRWLFVIARNSSFTFKGKAVDIKQVGRELGVRYVLEGSVRRGGNRLRITAQLIDAVSGAHVWAERYDRDISDVFAVQDELTATVAGLIEPALARAEQQRVMRKAPDRLDAWEAYQRGLWHFHKYTPEENQKALAFFRQAIALDPQFAPGHHGYALALQWEIWHFSNRPFSEVQGIPREQARIAVSLDDKDAMAHAILAHIMMWGGEWETAIAEARTALALNPNSAFVISMLGCTLGFGGYRDEALGRIHQAMRASPHDPLTWLWFMWVAGVQTFAGRYELALDALQQLARLRPEFPSQPLKAICLAHLGRLDEARRLLADVPTAARRMVDQRPPWIRPEDFATRQEGLRLAGLAAPIGGASPKSP
jgi:TolB-like protein/Flp pilus assembly protein TadD